ncbi:MAG TPA: cobalamin-binding protein [Fimbriiglobus sp.]
MVVIDSAGRSVRVPIHPTRIVSAAPACTEILFAVGAGDSVVGVTEYCNYPPEAAKRVKIGGFGPKTIGMETVVGLKPDVVFAAPGTQDPFIESVSRLGLPVVGVEARSFAEVYRAIEIVGAATGHVEKAHDLATGLRKRVEAVAARSIAHRPRVFYLLGIDKLQTVGPRTFVGEMIRLAGGDNTFEDARSLYPFVGEEELIRRDPDVIVVPRGPMLQLDADSIFSRPAWRDLRAVKNHRVIYLDEDTVSRAGPRLADALEQLAKELRK